LFLDKGEFQVRCDKWTWEFRRRPDYRSIRDQLFEGQCLATFIARNDTLTTGSSVDDFDNATNELVDICLILSFLFGKCVTPVNTTEFSDFALIHLSNKYIRARSISDIPELYRTTSLNKIFSQGLSNICNNFKARRMRLFLSHWISGLTCYTVEDLFLSACVQMDIVKQCEIAAIGNDLNYYEGMKQASNRYVISILSRDYKKMRDDLVHEGVLSGKNFKNKNKFECSTVIADTLNWIDLYILKVLKIDTYMSSNMRWQGRDIASGLPSLSLY
jgi:hypothetical protein